MMKSIIQPAVCILTLLLISASCRTPVEPPSATLRVWISPDTAQVTAYSLVNLQLHSSDTTFSPSKVLWDFGDGSGPVSSSEHASHQFSHTGRYNISAIAFDSVNHVAASASSVVIVTSTSFHARITASTDTVRDENAIIFRVAVSPVAADYYIWSCQGQDIYPANLEAAQCAFHDEGDYVVKVLCYKDNEMIAEDSIRIPVRFPHEAVEDLLRCAKVTSIFTHQNQSLTAIAIPMDHNTTVNGRQVVVQSVQNLQLQISGATVDSSVLKYTSFTLSPNGRYLLGHHASEMDSSYNETSKASHLRGESFGVDSLKLTYISDDTIIFSRPNYYSLFHLDSRDHVANASSCGPCTPTQKFCLIGLNDHGLVEVMFTRRE